MTEVLVHEVALRCSVEHAFAVFTAKVDLWWPRGHRKLDGSVLRHEAHEGGRLFERAPNGEEFVLADVLVCDPPHELRLAWHPGKITAPTQTVITFTAQGPHEAVVRVEHTEGAAALGAHWSSRAALFNNGWTKVLAALSTFIEREEDA